MKCQLCYHDTNNVSKSNRKFNQNPSHLNVARLSYQFLFYLIQSGNTFFYGNKIDIGNNIDNLGNSFDIFSKNVV